MISQSLYVKQSQIFFQFLLRDLLLYARDIKDDIINFIFLYPLINSIGFGYLQSNVYFGCCDPKRTTLYFAGNILLILVIISYSKVVPLVFDLEHERYIDYQLTLLPAWLIIVQRIIAVTLVTTALTIPFIGMAKIFIGTNLDLQSCNWIRLLISILISSYMCATYSFFALSVLKSNQLRIFWARINNPLMTLGGFWSPWYVMSAFNKVIGYLILANPFIYITESIRHSLLNPNAQFLPWYFSILMLIIFIIIFSTSSIILFKKRVDSL